MSTDYGQTWRSIVSNLGEQVARTLTEDHRNPDVLYLGTETGLFVSLDRGGAWQRILANLPTVRIDEITLHPRDNAMVLATHGRSLWVLDHLEPIQEYAAAQNAAARLFTPPTSYYRRPSRDRNYEFWGDQVFYGQNPPAAARLTWTQKQAATNVSLTIADATGAVVRTIGNPALASATTAGLQKACWDLRVEPAPDVRTSRLAEGGGPGGGAGGSGGPGRQTPSPFGAGCPQQTGPGGGGFGFGLGQTTVGPFVVPGTYTVSLVIDGKPVDSKPIRVVADPEVALTAAQRQQMFDMAMELHRLQGRVTVAVNVFGPFHGRLAELKKELAGRSGIPADVTTAFDALLKDDEALAPKLAPPALGRGGPGGFGGQGQTDYLIAKIGQAKSALSGGMWPTAATLKQAADAKAQSPKAIADMNALFAKAAGVSAALATHKLELKVPEAVK